MRSHRFSTRPQLLKAEHRAPSLARGAHGDGVAQIQNVLRDLNYPLVRSFSRGKADGIFGPETETAVKAFQKDHGLTSDGIAGPLTLGKLDQILVDKPYLDTVCPQKYRTDMLSDLGKPLGMRRNYYV